MAENLKWPKEYRTLLLQSVVIGKACEIYTQLTLEQSSNYDTLNELILKVVICGKYTNLNKSQKVNISP